MKHETVICQNCKRIYIKPIDKCECMHTSFTQTHQSNYIHAENLPENLPENIQENTKRISRLERRESTWKEILCKQVSTLNYWKNLFINSVYDLKERLFLDRSDAMVIIKIAQNDVYHNIIDKLKDKIDPEHLSIILDEAEKHQKMDNSAVGMFHNEKQITEGEIEIED